MSKAQELATWIETCAASHSKNNQVAAELRCLEAELTERENQAVADELIIQQYKKTKEELLEALKEATTLWDNRILIPSASAQHKLFRALLKKHGGGK